MLVSDIVTAAREDYLDDVEQPYLWPDASLIRMVGEAQRQATSRGDFLFDNTTPAITRISIVVGQFSYVLSPKITRIKSVLYNDKPICRRTWEEIDRDYPNWRTGDSTLSPDNPVAVVSGRTITLLPLPASAGLIKLDVFRRPNPVTALDDELEIIEEYQRDLIWWVLYECYQKRDADTYDPKKAKEYLMEFDKVFGPIVNARVRQHQLEAEHLHSQHPHNYQPRKSGRVDLDWQ